MSLLALTRVWAESRQRGGTLLVHLALADFADDDGGSCWPSVATLAAKSRMTPRNVQLALIKLASNREISILNGKGRNGTNSYQLLFGRGAKYAPISGVKTFQGGVKKDASEGVKKDASKRARISPDPSYDPGYVDPGSTIASPDLFSIENDRRRLGLALAENFDAENADDDAAETPAGPFAGAARALRAELDRRRRNGQEPRP